MRRVPVAIQGSKFQTLAKGVGLERTSNLGARQIGGVEPTNSPAVCLACPTKPCVTLTVNNVARDTCPIGAITTNPLSGQAEISNTCIGCGICALACPVGAIEVSSSGVANVNSGHNSGLPEVSSPSEFVKWLDQLSRVGNISQSDASDLADLISERLKPLKANGFYPIVANYLRLLGFEATSSNVGDTSSRADVRIFADGGLVPIEVKSYTEVQMINMKSVQQALENKVLSARHDEAAKPSPLSSLVIGFHYPSQRALILEMIDHIYQAFGFKVGLVSINRLVEEAILHRCNKIEFDANRLVHLKGMF